MLSPRVQMNLRNAKDYFREHLCAAEYYAEGHALAAEWFGVGAEKLGLKGGVGEKPFVALCEGRDPNTGEWLTLRKNTKRLEDGKLVANRRVFYDFTISPPKSVSVVGLYQDQRIVELHANAIRIALREMEIFAQTHVRKSGQNADRATRNVIGAAFLHETSRELDPHLHTHCIIMNATYDAQEERWKALEVSGMYRAQKFIENLYYHELSNGLISLGYELENSKHGFEIRGVPASVLHRFSKRHEQIDNETRKRQSAENTRGEIMHLRERIAHDGRRAKTKHATAQNLRPFWASQLTTEEERALNELRNLSSRDAKHGNPTKIVAWAEQHIFERRSVIHEHELLSTALVHARGLAVNLDEIKEAVLGRKYIRERGTNKLTTPDVLDCEAEIVRAAAEGQRRYSPFNASYDGAASLSEEQRIAVKQILKSTDFITLFRGAAGTGKSFTLRAIFHGISSARRPVFVLTPQKQQAIDLQKEGLPAQTLAHVLTTLRLAPHAAVIVDEAGQIGGKDLRTLIRLAKESGCRLILSGDTRQHGAVSASDSLRAIEKYSGLKAAEIRTIRRQDPATANSEQERASIHAYRDAVAAAANGEALKSFDQLDRLGWIRAGCRDDVAEEYIKAQNRKESALVVTQTRDEVNALNKAVRDRLVALGKLTPGKPIIAYQSIDATEAEKRDPILYRSVRTVFFHRAYGRYKKGDFCEVAATTENGVILMKNGRQSNVSFDYVNRFTLAAPVTMNVSPGDRLQLKFNGKSEEGEVLANGEIVIIRRIHADGRISIKSDRGIRKTLLPEQRFFNHGYAVTSYASQGKTVDRVLFVDAGSRAATSKNQWYVAISRARKSALIFTADKAALRANIDRSGDRELAVDFVSPVVDRSTPCPSTKNATSSIRYVKTLRDLCVVRPSPLENKVSL